jgi:DNA-directed RNA polymerase subunit M/transcription elongation factor TFIIS
MLGAKIAGGARKMVMRQTRSTNIFHAKERKRKEQEEGEKEKKTPYKSLPRVMQKRPKCGHPEISF